MTQKYQNDAGLVLALTTDDAGKFWTLDGTTVATRHAELLIAKGGFKPVALPDPDEEMANNCVFRLGDHWAIGNKETTGGIVREWTGSEGPTAAREGLADAFRQRAKQERERCRQVAVTYGSIYVADAIAKLEGGGK